MIRLAWLAACALALSGCNGEELNGTMRFVGVEGGCWTIDFGSQRVQPVGLPDEFKQDGLEVAVKLSDMPDAVSICQVGPIKKIESIRKR